MKLSYILAFFIIHMFALIFVPCLKKKNVVFKLVRAFHIEGKNFPHIRFNARKRKIIILKKKKTLFDSWSMMLNFHGIIFSSA